MSYLTYEMRKLVRVEKTVVGVDAARMTPADCDPKVSGLTG